MILVTAATRWEASPLVTRWNLEASGSGWYRGWRENEEIFVLPTGIGSVKTREALARLKNFNFGSSWIAISSGLAGALQPGIRSGEVVADLREAPIEIVHAAQRTAQNRGISLHLGAIQSSSKVLKDPAEKRDLGVRQRAIAVDMESAAVRDWCRSRGGTFLAIRAVLDSLEDRLPGLPPEDGEASASRWLRYLMDEWRNLPLMTRLFVRQRRAMSVLTRFLDGLIKEMETETEDERGT